MFWAGPGPPAPARLATHMKRLPLAALAIWLLAAPLPAAADSQEAWAALVSGGHVALIRHGNAPPGYGGDPPGFKIDDCATQQNLDEKGRRKPWRSARPSVNTECARRRSSPRPGAGAWRRRG